MIGRLKSWLREKKNWSAPPPRSSEQDVRDLVSARAQLEYERQLSELRTATEKRRAKTLDDVRRHIDEADALMRKALGSNA